MGGGRTYQPGKLSAKELADPEYVQAYIDETFRTIDDIMMDSAELRDMNRELLQALKLALDYYRSYGTAKFSPYEVEQALEQAIAKAEIRK